MDMVYARQAGIERPTAKQAAAYGALMLCAISSLAALAPSGVFAQQEADRRQSRPFALQYAYAEDVAPQVREALSRMPGKPEVFVDVNRNRVLVKGDRNAMEVAAELIETLDASTEEEQDPQTKPIARGYRVDPELLDATLQSLRELYRDQPGVTVNSDKRTSKIVVFALPEVHEEVQKAIAATELAPAQRRVPQNRPDRTLGIAAAPRRAMPPQGPAETVHRFNNLTWEEFEDALIQIWGGKAEVTPDVDGEAAEVRLVTRDGETHFIRINRRRNQVEASQPESVAHWKKIARVLDGLETKAGQEARLMSVANAKPAHLQQVVYALQRNEGEVKKPMSMQALRRDPATARWGGDLVSRVFEQDPATQPPPGERPAEGAAQDPAQEPTDEDLEPISPDVRIEYIEGLDIIVIIGPPRDVERVKKLIEQLDDPVRSQPDVRIVDLKHTNNEVLAPLLTQINDQVLSTRQGRVTIIPLGKPNSILLLGQKESVDVMEKYIAKLDFETDPEKQFRVFRLRYLAAVDAETAIRNFFSNNPGPSGQQQQQQQQGNDTTRFLPGLGTRVRVIAEGRSNSLIVQGGAGDLKSVERLLNEIDVEESRSQLQLRVFTLKSSLAADLAPILQAAISGQPTQGGQAGQGGQPGQGNQAAPGTATARSASLQFVQVDNNGKASFIDSGIPTNVTIEADIGSNKLLVRGPARTIEMVEYLIKQLDTAASAGASIKVFRIINGDAQQIYTNLQQLFGTTTQGGAGAASGPPTSEGESPLVGLRFTFDRQSNSVIATGNPGDLSMVEAILDNIDVDDMSKRALHVYRLVNNDAEFVATAITTLINNQQTQIRQQAQTNLLISARSILESEVFVTPELVTNSVIISATPKKLPEIVQVIQRLDLRQPMVLVQMVIAEVALENITELGAEFGLQDSILFDRGFSTVGGAATPGFPFNNQPLGNGALGQNNVAQRSLVAPQGLTHFGVGRTSNSRGYGGLVLSASSESVSILLRALHERNRLQVLSRPEVMTIDRMPANVLVGESVPLVGEVVTGINGNTTSVVREDVGLSMIVIPQVNADGQIVIDVNARRSALGNLADGLPIPDGSGGTVLQPRIQVTSAVSTISCRSGQTVIMSGLITKTREKQERAIPYLSDIPYAGELFKFRSERERRTELLMILTPHIIWDGDDLEWVKQMETERMSWCLADVADIDGDRGYAQGKGLWGSLRNRTIFPHIQPRGVAECTPPPGPLDPIQRIQGRLHPECPPEENWWQAPPGTGMPAGPPSELENRSHWGPYHSPHSTLEYPLDGSAAPLEEVQPFNIPPTTVPEGEPPATPPRDPLNEGAMKLHGPRPSEAGSMRSAIRARDTSTRRAAQIEESPADEDFVERASYQPRAANARRPAAREEYELDPRTSQPEQRGRTTPKRDSRSAPMYESEPPPQRRTSGASRYGQ
jgi:general secretion pathway protein D